MKIGRKGEDPIVARLRLAKQSLWKATFQVLVSRGLDERQARALVAWMKKHPPGVWP